MSAELLFLTIATGDYWIFAAPFAAACLATFPDCRVEILVERSRVYDIVSQGVTVSDRVCLRPILSSMARWEAIPRHLRVNDYPSRHPAGSIRWLTVPRTAAHYVYVCDVDILISDTGLFDWHKAFMSKFSLPYSNIHRQDHPEGVEQGRMTGCHFADYGWFYSAAMNLYRDMVRDDISCDQKAQRQTRYYDERILYHLCDLAECLPPPELKGRYKWRPIHGIHTSLKRDPKSRLGWNLRAKPIRDYRRLQETPVWKLARPFFAPEYLALLERLEAEISHVG